MSRCATTSWRGARSGTAGSVQSDARIASGSPGRAPDAIGRETYPDTRRRGERAYVRPMERGDVYHLDELVETEFDYVGVDEL